MIVPFAELAALRQQHTDASIVLGSGVFDLLHRGHITYLQRLREHGDIVVVMVKPDERVRFGKGTDRPVLPEADRAAMVDAVKGVDYVFVPPHMDWRGKPIDPMYEAVLTALKPTVFYTTNPFWEQLEHVGGARVVIDSQPKREPLRSTTSIIAHIHKLGAHA
jgi:cytidyltransferase-like protein